MEDSGGRIAVDHAIADLLQVRQAAQKAKADDTNYSDFDETEQADEEAVEGDGGG